MRYASRFLVGVLGLGTIGQVSQTTPVLADTWTGNGTSGTWGPDENGTTTVSTTIASSYTVTIPQLLTLPQSDTYTTESNNVNILDNAHIPGNETIHVNLAGNQAFTAFQGTSQSHTDAVSFKVKLGDGAKLSNTTDPYEILSATASQAHDTGASTSVNVGFDTAPDFKFAGSYTGHIQFEIAAQSTSPVVNNGDGTLQFANHRWRILVNGATDNNQAGATRAGDYLVIRETPLTNSELGQAGEADAAGKMVFSNNEYYFDINGTNGYTRSLLKPAIDAYAQTLIDSPTLTAGILPVSLNDQTFDEYKSAGEAIEFTNDWYWNWHANKNFTDTRGYTTLGGTKQAFALSHGDINTIMEADSAHPFVEKFIFDAQSNFFWLRSPAQGAQTAAVVRRTNGSYQMNLFPNEEQSVQPAFWLTTN